MSENDEKSVLYKLGILEGRVNALDDKIGDVKKTVSDTAVTISTMGKQMEEMARCQAEKNGEEKEKKTIFESYIKPLLFPITVGYTLWWLTSAGSKMLAAFDAIAKGGIK